MPPETRNMKHALFFVALLLASCKPASAPPAVSVDGAWARATVPGQTGSAAYFTIRNAGGPDKLLSVTSPAADASLHSTSMDNGVMRKRPLEALDVPARGTEELKPGGTHVMLMGLKQPLQALDIPEKGTVELKPGGTHVMLMGLKQPLQAGLALELDLKFEKSGERKVSAQVRPTGAGAGM
jgi:copper(I)-binding protein